MLLESCKWVDILHGKLISAVRVPAQVEGSGIKDSLSGSPKGLLGSLEKPWVCSRTQTRNPLTPQALLYRAWQLCLGGGGSIAEPLRKEVWKSRSH